VQSRTAESTTAVAVAAGGLKPWSDHHSDLHDYSDESGDGEGGWSA